MGPAGSTPHVSGLPPPRPGPILPQGLYTGSSPNLALPSPDTRALPDHLLGLSGLPVAITTKMPHAERLKTTETYPLPVPEAEV